MKKYIIAIACLFSAMTSFAQDALTIENTVIDPGQTGVLNVILTNPETSFIACQFDVTLPAGLDVQRTSKGEVSKAKTCALTDRSQDEEEEFAFTYTIKEMESGHFRFTMYNDANEPFFGESGGAIMQLTVTASDSFSGGEGKIHAITITNDSRKGFNPADATFIIATTTGINDVKVSNSDAPVYNLAGQRVMNAQKGLFIQNGKKVVK